MISKLHVNRVWQLEFLKNGWCLLPNRHQTTCHLQCDSYFPSRGDLDEDRQFRHPRQRADRKLKTETASVRGGSISSPGLQDALTGANAPNWENEWSLLPEVDVVKEGVAAFTTHYFQLGFIPKERFPLQLQQNPGSMSVFLLLSILSISARFNKKIQAHYGESQKAVDWFMRGAERLAINELYQQPTLERCQAFLLLSIAQQGCGMSNSSYVSRISKRRDEIMLIVPDQYGRCN